MRFNNFWCYRRILFSRGFASALWHSRQNLLAYAQGRPLEAGPYMAELDITYQCNSRCRMCQRWNDPRRDELSLAEYQKLARVLHEMGSHQISIAGGEPLLREDVFPIIDCFTGLKMSVNLCTNGLLLSQYVDEICQSGITCLTVSLDGASANTHDNMRERPGSYNQITEGINRILRYPASSRPILRVRMTVSNRNAHEIRAFYEKWHQVADDVLIQPVHHCLDAYYTGMDEASLRIDPGLLADQVVGTPFETDTYLKRLIRSLEASQEFPYQQQCYSAVLMARIDPWGNVYPCLEQHVWVGSIRKQDFRSIWNSDRLQKERKRLSSGRPCRCWYNNTALIGHYGKKLSPTFQKIISDWLQHPIAASLPSVFSKK